jgi:DNA polymerase-3 subunit delta'
MTIPLDGGSTWPIIGHEATVDYLAHGIRSGRVAHAHLLIGQPGIGRYTLARTYAQALNCQSDLSPCGVCRTCRLIAEDTHPDVRTVQMPPEKREISIDQIRAMQHEATLRPYEATWKAYIVRDAEHLSEEAANCLLKTLEEPPPQVTMTLVAPSTEALLSTIVSRCQVLTMHPVPVPRIEATLLEQYHCDPEQARLLARISAGRIGWAILAARDNGVLTARQQLMDRLVRLGPATRVDRLAFAAEHGQRYGKDVTEREAVHAMLGLWSGWWRDLLLTASGCGDRIMNLDRIETLQIEARRYPTPQIRAFLESIGLAERRLRQNVNPRLALEVLALTIPRPGH